MRRVALLLSFTLLMALTCVHDGVARSEEGQSYLESSQLFGSELKRSDTLRYPFLTIGTSEVSLGFDTYVASIGTQGSEDSFESPPGSGDTYLFQAALWIGAIIGNDTLVSSGADGWSFGGDELQWLWDDQSEINDYSLYTDHDGLWRIFTDTSVIGVDPDWSGRPHYPLNVEVRHRSHAWHDEPEAGTVLHDVLIRNIGMSTIQDGFLGLFVDADVVSAGQQSDGAGDDVSGSFPAEGIGYIIDTDGDLGSANPVPKILAVKMLHISFTPLVSNFNWWISNVDASRNFGPRRCDDTWFDFGNGCLGTPEGDVNKYYVLSHPEWDYDQVRTATIPADDPMWCYPDPALSEDFAVGYDARFLLSAGPFELPPGEYLRIIFATFTGEDVHTNPDNVSHLPDDPDSYLAGLDFDDMFANAYVSDSLAAYLLSPLGPVQGLRQQPGYSDYRIVWDPWVGGSSEIDGYDIYVQAVPEDSIPYPGLMPPWLKPDPGVWQYYAGVGLETSENLSGLDGCSFYFASVRQTSALGDGDSTAYVSISPEPPTPPTTSVQSDYVVEPGEPFTLGWEPPDGVNVSEYHVYRFSPEDSNAFWINRQSMALYSTTSSLSDATLPIDSFDVSGQMYYFYRCEPLATVGAGVTEYTDYAPVDGAVYRVSVVNECGHESNAGNPRRLHIVEPKSRDILLLQDGCESYSYCDSLMAFYDELLSGFDHDIYWLVDSIAQSSVDWGDMMKYRTILVDGGISKGEEFYELAMYDGFLEIYSLSGGKIVHFGIPHGWYDWWTYMDPGWHPYASSPAFLLGLDSVYLVHAFEGYDGVPVDSLYGFEYAESLIPGKVDYWFDPFSECFVPPIDSPLWSPNSPPSVVGFGPTDSAEVTHVFHGLYPNECLMEGLPVGIRHQARYWDYLDVNISMYGFHPWYMNIGEMRLLIMEECDCQPTTCCIGIRGNVTGDLAEDINIADITYLISFLFSGGPPSPCMEEADVNADALINIADMTHLIAYLFSGGPSPVDCP